MAAKTFSVLGPDTAIRGDIVATSDIHVDGRIEGDIACQSLILGETGVITGAIAADTARIAGQVRGSIVAREMVVLRTARIEGDVSYEALTIEQGAQVDGRFSPRGHAIPDDTRPDDTRPGDGEPRLSLASSNQPA